MSFEEKRLTIVPDIMRNRFINLHTGNMVREWGV